MHYYEYLEDIRLLFPSMYFEITSMGIYGKVENFLGNTSFYLSYDGRYGFEELNYGSAEEIKSLRNIVSSWSSKLALNTKGNSFKRRLQIENK